ncbi:MAG: GGDEF domain-containing protein [Dehalococcoidia bacterium]
MAEDKQPPEDYGSLGTEGSVDQVPSVEPRSDWREARAATLRKVTPVTPAAGPEPGLRELTRYLLASLTFISIGVSLALIDEKWHTPHLTAAVAVLMLAVVATSIVAMYRVRLATAGLRRSALPSLRDSVTGLPDEEYFRMRLKEECRRTHRYDTPLSVALFDVNNLSSVNEAYGEAAGDAVLRHVGNLLESTKRASDITARLGDDEFALMLLECGPEDASHFLHRLEHQVARRPVTATVEGQSITLWVGICIGMASIQEGQADPARLLADARSNLDAAKQERDRRRERWTAASS